METDKKSKMDGWAKTNERGQTGTGGETLSTPNTHRRIEGHGEHGQCQLHVSEAGGGDRVDRRTTTRLG